MVDIIEKPVVITNTFRFKRICIYYMYLSDVNHLTKLVYKARYSLVVLKFLLNSSKNVLLEVGWSRCVVT